MKVASPLSITCLLAFSSWHTVAATATTTTLELEEDGAAAKEKVGSGIRGTPAAAASLKKDEEERDGVETKNVLDNHVEFSPKIQDMGKEPTPTLRRDYNATLDVSDVTVDRKLAGPPGTSRTVCGDDTRQRIHNTDDAPWERIADLKVTVGNSGYQCTGFFISKRVLMTAGHCVYIHDAGGWADRVEVCPGAYDEDQYPYGCQYASTFKTSYEWFNSRNANYDYAALILPDTTMWDSGVSYFGFRSDSTSTLRSYTSVNVAGYPGDKDGGATLWWNAGAISATTSRRIKYPMDTAGGMSGGPVWIYSSDGYRYVIGIHTNGNCPSNLGVRIEGDLFAYMRDLKNTYT